MDLWQLNIFCKVVENKSFSKAGKAVHLSQPTISSHIRDLEEHFACRLIDRLGKEAVPTAAGLLLYSHARRMLRLRDETESAMAAFLGTMRGTLVVGASSIPGGYILPGKIGAFMADHPDVTISLRIHDTERIIQDTLSGETELGFVGAKSSDRRILQEKILDDSMCVVIPPDHPWTKRKSVTPKELRKEPFITREMGSGTRRGLADALKPHRIGLEDFKVVAEMGNSSAVVQAIRSGMGVSILSPIAVAEEIAEGKLGTVKVDGIDLSRSFYLVRHKDRTPSPVCRAFMNFLSGTFGNTPVF